MWVHTASVTHLYLHSLTSQPLAAGTFLNYDDGLLVLESVYFSNVAIAYMCPQSFDVQPDPQKTTLFLYFQSLCEHLFRLTVLRRGNSKIPASKARETIS